MSGSRAEHRTTLAEGLRTAVGIMGKATRKPECTLTVLALYVWRWLATLEGTRTLWPLAGRTLDLESTWETARQLAEAPDTAPLGAALNAFAARLEEDCPPLRGLFTAIDFDAPACEPEGQPRGRLLARLVQHLPAPDRWTHDNDPGAMAQAFETIVRRLAGRDKGRLGLRATPPELARLAVGLAELAPGRSLLDPHCGTGDLLVAAALAQDAHDPPPCGQEGHPDARWLARLRLLLRGLHQVRIRPPEAPPETDRPRFDRVLTCLPLSAADTTDSAAGVPLPQHWGTTTPRRADWARLHQALDHLAPHGLGVLVVPRGLLFRAGAERELRARLLTAHGLAAVIGLPALPASPAQAILIVRPNPSPERARPILFIQPDARADLDAGMQARILDTYREWRAEAGFSRLLEAAEIGGDRHQACLDPAHYVHRAPTDDGLDLTTLRATIQDAERRRDQAARRMDRLLDAWLGGAGG